MRFTGQKLLHNARVNWLTRIITILAANLIGFWCISDQPITACCSIFGDYSHVRLHKLNNRRFAKVADPYLGPFLMFFYATNDLRY